MTALLDLPEIRSRVSRLSVAEYHQLGEFNENGKRTELIRGIVVEKMSKSPLHYVTLQRLNRILVSQVPPGCDLRIEGPLTLHDSEPEPDLAVVRGVLDEFTSDHPQTAELVVEVAVSTLATDRAKAEIYAEAGVREYWIVCPDERRVEVYRAPVAGRFSEQTVVEGAATLASTALPGLQVDFAPVWK